MLKIKGSVEKAMMVIVLPELGMRLWSHEKIVYVIMKFKQYVRSTHKHKGQTSGVRQPKFCRFLVFNCLV